uniref:Uncharacterized protein n=1 Tax=Anguilla anguilla TaxID=7936 RepID=A0A0E9USH2_ANGAN
MLYSDPAQQNSVLMNCSVLTHYKSNIRAWF